MFNFPGRYLLGWGLFCTALFAVPAGAVSIRDGGAGFTLEVASVKELRFQGVTRQKYDFSCGSAAVATLLSHHYEDEISEETVFRGMYEYGDRDKIVREGFSMLDMKDYLEANGYRADGFRVPLERLIKVGVPAIALIDDGGYQHFVVIKGVNQRQLLLGDPAKGLLRVSRARFEEMWNGVLFVILNRKRIAQQHFNSEVEWRRHTTTAPLHAASQRRGLASFTLLLPGFDDF